MSAIHSCYSESQLAALESNVGGLVVPDAILETAGHTKSVQMRSVPTNKNWHDLHTWLVFVYALHANLWSC